jgi:hypothetical protein
LRVKRKGRIIGGVGGLGDLDYSEEDEAYGNGRYRVLLRQYGKVSLLAAGV